MWSLKNGSEITRTTRDENVLSFAWSRDGKLLAISHLSGNFTVIVQFYGHAILRSCNCLSAVRGGVLIVGEMGSRPRMWNFELSKCVREWTSIGCVTDVIPISEEKVACTTEESEVIILDATSGEILLTMQIDSTTDLLACNSKFQILTSGRDGLVRLSDRETTLWKRELRSTKFGRFSPAETFVIIYSTRFLSGGMYVLDAASGKTLHIFCGGLGVFSFFDCEFVSDEECVAISKAPSEQCRVQLFNVKSGDLLSNLLFSDLRLNDMWEEVNCSAASPCKRLVAIYPSDSKHGYELIQVRLPGDEDSRKSKRYDKRGNKCYS